MFCDIFLAGDYQPVKFYIATTVRMSYTKPIHAEIKQWFADNIDRLIVERPSWSDVTRVPDEFLPPHVLAAEGWANRRRSSVSVRELVGLEESVNANNS